MCGINGFITRKDLKDSKLILESMNDAIVHRGPDSGGTFLCETEYGIFGLGMRRLSIIDIASGNQPFYSEDKLVVLVFNGEIYNYRKLRDDLAIMGHVFKTNSDTEVILHCYLQYGIECCKYFDGMFAFSILDRRLNKLFIARDFFGEKPLYYTEYDGNLVWASELKSIKVFKNSEFDIDKDALHDFMRLTYIPAPKTIYKGVKKLQRNSVIEYDLISKDLSIRSLGLEKRIENKMHYTEAVKLTHNYVWDSVQSRLVSDVPVGTFLSGGVDSSIVSYCHARLSSKKIDTFSIVYKNSAFDERSKSRLVSKLIGSNHHEFELDYMDLMRDLDRVILNFDEPFADSSALPTYFISKQTSDFGLKVVLTGDGGDEIFAGYNKYYIAKFNKIYTSLIKSNHHEKLANIYSLLLRSKSDIRGLNFKLMKLLNSIDYTGNSYANIISLGFSQSDMDKLFKSDVSINPINFVNPVLTLRDMVNVDLDYSLDSDLLTKVDSSSMLNSLEARSPLLNKELYNFVSSLPENYLLDNFNKKKLLKDSFKRYFPENFLNNKKSGFGVPVGNWLRAELKEELLGYVEKKFIVDQNLFNYIYIRNLVEDHIEGRIDNTFKVWTFFCFQKWYKNSYKIES